MDIEANLAAFTDDLGPEARYASFDYCFNYFRSFRERDRTADIAAPWNLQMSCLQLGFYLASWGMLRGSSTLLRKSARHYEPVIDVIAGAPAEVWDLDADRYSTETWSAVWQLDQQIRRAFGHDNGVMSALATKVMLGVFGNVPAFDTRFRRGFPRRRLRPQGVYQARRVLPRARGNHRAASGSNSGLPDRATYPPPVQPGQGHRHDLFIEGGTTRT